MDVLSDVVSVARTGRPHSGRVTRSAPFSHRFPAVPSAGFHIVLQGTCWLLPSQGDPIALGPGDVVFLPRGSAHGLADDPATPVSEPPSTLTGVHGGRDDETPADRPPTVVMLCGAYLLDSSGPHPLLNDLPEVIHLPTRVGHQRELRAAVELLGVELDGDARPGSDTILLTLLDLLLLYILRAWFEAQHASGHAATGWAAALRDSAVAPALRAIHGDPGRQWTVEELGAQARLSRAAFARRFTRLVGQPPLTYLTWWRMTTAARLLRISDAPVDTIARQVGYSSQYTFTHAFKRQYGSPPGSYRRQAD
ncbi:AraC family transcriptional regulator [Glycomyces algeriensis]|uniref:AraC family transcriptional regulator n=1 Tax=Glycomyces algeriensis TaxID=256037 RepID=A0A9W6G4M4_9ACTN|nr:AraC family transcriptional regulator [Glycomyces algeriensis]MDA1368057.1 AraC family transcriptional regulator [Glycomyces algeriensis]MDR7352569.1 AraC-like DNA-binding protein [Glycomyces algeriensis]GLI40247.1 AraC family transcriptional regulator [Glycomyces algeriensis]